MELERLPTSAEPVGGDGWWDARWWDFPGALPCPCGYARRDYWHKQWGLVSWLPPPPPFSLAVCRRDAYPGTRSSEEEHQLSLTGMPSSLGSVQVTPVACRWRRCFDCRAQQVVSTGSDDAQYSRKKAVASARKRPTCVVNPTHKELHHQTNLAHARYLALECLIRTYS